MSGDMDTKMYKRVIFMQNITKLHTDHTQIYSLNISIEINTNMYYVLHSGLIAKLYTNYEQTYSLQISLEIGTQMYYVLHPDLITKISKPNTDL